MKNLKIINMYKYNISFIALTDTLSLDINYPNPEELENVVKELMFIFAKIDEENENIIIESFQRNTNEIRKKINEFIDKYKVQIPQLNGVAAYFRKLQEEEYFYFLPNIKLDQIDSVRLFDYLKATVDGKDFNELNSQTQELFGELMKKYTIMAIGDKRINIGEPNKSKRICRFCNNKKDPLTFDNVAHAISEALGNKTVRLHDECDICNSEFSRKTEKDIIHYLALFRTLFDVKGKGGSKQFIGNNFELKNESTVELRFYGDNTNSDKSLPYRITLETKEPISYQNIYKCLCKYFISVIDNQELTHFKETINWINGDFSVDKLPLVGEMISYHHFTKQPHLVTYLRKVDEKNLPYAVGEFFFTCLVFSFIVPLSDQDDRDFTSLEDYENFWTTFRHYKMTTGWAKYNYSNDKKKKLILNLNFEKNDSSIV